VFDVAADQLAARRPDQPGPPMALTS
jgi:hypothetical protein